MMKSNVFDYIATGIATCFSLIDVENICSIISLCLVILFYIIKCGIAIYTKIKQKKYDEIDDVIDDTIDKIENKLDGDKKNDNE